MEKGLKAVFLGVKKEDAVNIVNECPSRNELIFTRSRKMRILTTGIH